MSLVSLDGLALGEEAPRSASASSPDARSEQHPTILNFDKSLNTFRQAVITLLADFAARPGTAKEKEFTPLLQQLLKLKHDSLQSSCACPALLRNTETVIDVCTDGKTAARPMRGYQKANKLTHLEALPRSDGLG